MSTHNHTQGKESHDLFISSNNTSIFLYECKHCGALAKKDTVPKTDGCHVKKRHSWLKLGEVGDIYYGCNKCSTIIHVKSSPAIFGCPKGLFHSWKKL